jgi:hypothetical protein
VRVGGSYCDESKVRYGKNLPTVQNQICLVENAQTQFKRTGERLIEPEYKWKGIFKETLLQLCELAAYDPWRPSNGTDQMTKLVDSAKSTPSSNPMHKLVPVGADKSAAELKKHKITSSLFLVGRSYLCDYSRHYVSTSDTVGRTVIEETVRTSSCIAVLLVIYLF